MNLINKIKKNKFKICLLKILNKFKNNFFVSFKFGFDSYNKLKFFIFLFLIPIFKKGLLKINFSVKLVLKYDNKKFIMYLADISDFAAFLEIFVKEEYKINLKVEPKVIFDFGSNSGLSVIYFKLKYPSSKIYSFEPNPIVFKQLEKNVSQFQDVYCFNYAISSSDTNREFYLSRDSSLSSSFINRNLNSKILKVQTKNTLTIINELKIEMIDLLKFDVEGWEFDIFTNSFPFYKMNNAIGEVHMDLNKTNFDKDSFLNFFSSYKLDTNVISCNRFILKLTNKNNAFNNKNS